MVIKTSFRDYSAKENQIVVTIDPKMSFGNGAEHQTTKIVLKLLLEKYITKNLSSFMGKQQFGIAAAKLGCEKVTCVGYEWEWCYINGLENIERKESLNISIINGDINSVIDFKYDVVVGQIILTNI